MDQTALVGPDIPAGKKLIEALDRVDPRIEAAFWWLDEDSWKLILASPRVHEEGTRAVYSDILDAIESSAELPHELFQKVEVHSPSALLIRALDLGGEGRLNLGRFVLGESVGGAYVKGAYFYRFQPKTFAKAS